MVRLPPRPGDEIIALNGELVPVTSTAGWIGGWLKANGDKPVRVDLRRKGAYHTVTVLPMPACAIPINLQTSETANAETDGTKIIVHSAMLDITRTDAQLAVVVGHELAHANLGHHEKKQINALLGTTGGALVDIGFLLGGIPTDGIFTRQFRLAGTNAFSIGFEREADYVGLYYAARAGYALAGVEQVWREFGKLHPESIRFAATHPTTPMRIVQLQKVAAEIADKQRRNLPLVPELKLVNAGADAAIDTGKIR